MSFWTLKNIKDDWLAWRDSYYSLPPDACPRCGEPLQVGWQTDQDSGGKVMMRHCPLGHYSWQGGVRET